MKKLFGAALAAVMVFAFTTAPAVAGNYWDGWTKVYSLDMFPECGVNVLGAGGDDILQETVDVYCGVNPGGYVAYINPKMMNVYKKKGKKYPDGQVGVLVFEKIGAAFTTDIKGGKPIMDVKAIADGKSIASKEKGHPLNPQTCFNCHETVQGGVCKKHGYVCGDVVFRTE